MEKTDESRNLLVARHLPRVRVMLDLNWPYKRHSAIFAGVQRFAEERGWVSIIREFAHDIQTLPPEMSPGRVGE